MIPVLGLRIRVRVGERIYSGVIDEVVRVYDPKLADRDYVYRFVIATGQPYPNHLISLFGDTIFEVIQ